MKTTTIINIVILGLASCVNLSCKKYLDVKPDDKIAIIATLDDAQMLLDNFEEFNAKYPNSSEIQSDNHYLTETNYNALDDYIRNVYTWKKIEFKSTDDWTRPYQVIFNANTILDAYPKIMANKIESQESKNVFGSALFFRAYHFFALAQLYIPIYNQNSATNDLGLPLRLDADFNIPSKRSTVQETYERIINDLKRAATLLPITPLVKSRPSKPAAFGALARVYLSMRDYLNAGLYADSCLQLYSDLIDFNTLNPSSSAPFTRFHKEVIIHIKSIFDPSLAPSRAKIDADLYNSYNNNDLRKTIYFGANTGTNAGTYNFKGNYDPQSLASQNGFVFGGIATDEMYLIRAEAYARSGNLTLALKDLNDLLKTRWKGAYTLLTVPTPSDAVNLILTERRKELFNRGTRWTDLRRLSKEPEHSVVPKRILGTEIYELQPGSLRYLLLFPTDVIKISGMQQNP